MTRLFRSRAPTWLRISGLLLGILLFIWLPIEDSTERGVILFSIAICAWLAARLCLGLDIHSRWFFVTHTLYGLLAGLCLSPVALLLMAFKSGVHGHGFPDFTPDQVSDILRRTPMWTGAGLLLGLGSGLWRSLNAIQVP